MLRCAGTIALFSIVDGHSPSNRVEVEFHIVPGDTPARAIHGAGSRVKNHKAHVQHIILRLHTEEDEPVFPNTFDGKDSVARMDQIIVTCFEHLALVTVETTGDIQDPAFVRFTNRLPLVRAQGWLEQRTCSEADKGTERIADPCTRGSDISTYFD